MRFLIVCSLVLGLAALAAAQSPSPDPVLGSRPGAFGARSLSLGHSFLTDQTGPAALAGNPATLTTQVTRWHLELGGDVSRVKETRKYPFYDAFAGVLAYNNYALNDHLYSKLEGGLSYRLPLQPVESLVLSAGSYALYRFDYLYHEEVRDRYSAGGIQDRRLGENRLDVEGDLRSVSVGAATKLHGPLSVGASLSAVTGEWTYTKGVYYANPDSLDIVNQTDYSPDGNFAEMAFGVTYAVSPRVTLGLRTLTPLGDYTVKRDYRYILGDSTLVQGSQPSTVTYPSHYALGVKYQPRGEYHPVLLLEGEIHTNSDLDPNLDDTFEIRAGAEQQLVPGAPVRFGFVYANAPSDKERATTLFTAGIGFTLQKFHGDLGVELGKMNYQARDLFPQSLYGNADRTDLDHVETALFRGLITLSYAL